MLKQMSVRTALAAALCAIASTTLFARSAEAQNMVFRHDRWQFSVPITWAFGVDLDGKGGSTVNVNDDVGWGFGFGYHLSEQFMLGFETTWFRASYTANVETDGNGDLRPDSVVSLGGTLDASSMQAVGQFNMLENKRVTPFARGNLGFTYTDSNIPSGPAQGGCWWDPWWGYICDAWQPTYDEFSFSFGGALGVRADMGQRFFIELAGAGSWIAFEEATPFLGGVRMNVGWLF